MYGVPARDRQGRLMPMEVNCEEDIGRGRRCGRPLNFSHDVITDRRGGTRYASCEAKHTWGFTFLLESYQSIPVGTVGYLMDDSTPGASTSPPKVHVKIALDEDEFLRQAPSIRAGLIANGVPEDGFVLVRMEQTKGMRRRDRRAANRRGAKGRE